MHYYEYEVAVWEDNRELNYSGLTTGKTYSDALAGILEFYDSPVTPLLSVKLEEWESSGCLIISKEALQEIRENNDNI